MAALPGVLRHHHGLLNVLRRECCSEDDSSWAREAVHPCTTAWAPKLDRLVYTLLLPLSRGVTSTYFTSPLTQLQFLSLN